MLEIWNLLEFSEIFEIVLLLDKYSILVTYLLTYLLKCHASKTLMILVNAEMPSELTKYLQ